MRPALGLRLLLATAFQAVSVDRLLLWLPQGRSEGTAMEGQTRGHAWEPPVQRAALAAASIRDETWLNSSRSCRGLTSGS